MHPRSTEPSGREGDVDEEQAATARGHVVCADRDPEAASDRSEAGRPQDRDVAGPWVFTTPVGKQVDGDNLRSRVFNRILEKAELPRIRLHDLRHTYASLLIQQGESLA